MRQVYIISTLIILLLFTATNVGYSQHLLDKPVTVDVKKRPVKDVLDLIGKRGNFSFSYSNTIVRADSLVTVVAVNKPVKQLLQMMFGDSYQYKEIDNHIIILQAEKEKWYTVSGTITDGSSGIIVTDASVFERQQLATTLTDENGHYRLRLKDKGKYAEAEITISKGGFYRDTTIHLQQGFDQEVSVSLTPATHTLPDIFVSQYSSTERSWFGKYLFSSKLKKQSANLGKFFVDKPVQASFIPGVGSHGKMSGQVTNKVSLNVLGGYAAGVSGVEVGGIFNIDKKDVQYVQVGGIFNIVNGGMKGVQVGGIANTVSKSVSGVQVSGIASQIRGNMNGCLVAGICSRVGGSMKGLQISGIANMLDNADSVMREKVDTAYLMEGMQLAGISNITNGKSKGFQLAGISNISRRGMEGVQMSGIVNITTRLDGSQIGLINIADTVTGYTIGLINIVKKGYHMLCLSSNELLNINVAYKAGNRKLYNILTICANVGMPRKAYAYGIGAGTERIISRKISIAAEATVVSHYQGPVNNGLIMLKLDPVFNWNIARKFTLYTGPCVRIIPYVPAYNEVGYVGGVPSSALYNFEVNTPLNTAAWLGWQIGFHIF